MLFTVPFTHHPSGCSVRPRWFPLKEFSCSTVFRISRSPIRDRPMSPALQDRFLTTGPPGKSLKEYIMFLILVDSAKISTLPPSGLKLLTRHSVTYESACFWPQPPYRMSSNIRTFWLSAIPFTTFGFWVKVTKALSTQNYESFSQVLF